MYVPHYRCDISPCPAQPWSIDNRRVVLSTMEPTLLTACGEGDASRPAGLLAAGLQACGSSRDPCRGSLEEPRRLRRREHNRSPLRGERLYFLCCHVRCLRLRGARQHLYILRDNLANIQTAYLVNMQTAYLVNMSIHCLRGKLRSSQLRLCSGEVQPLTTIFADFVAQIL